MQRDYTSNFQGRPFANLTIHQGPRTFVYNPDEVNETEIDLGNGLVILASSVSATDLYTRVTSVIEAGNTPLIQFTDGDYATFTFYMARYNSVNERYTFAAFGQGADRNYLHTCRVSEEQAPQFFASNFKIKQDEKTFTGDSNKTITSFVQDQDGEIYVEFSKIFNAIVTAWSNPLRDDNIPSEKLVKDSLDDKVDKVEGKGLSTNDYTDEAKAKVDNIPAVAMATSSLTCTAPNTFSWSIWTNKDVSIPLESLEIGGRIYPYVQIGNQLWITENLDYKWPGLVIGANNISSSEPRGNYYDNNETAYGVNGNRYGLLYNWIAAEYLEQNKATLLPSGWHVPTKSELETLIAYVGGSSIAGLKLKSTSGWAQNGNGDGSSGFSAQPTGYRHNNGDYYDITLYNLVWSLTMQTDPNYFAMFLDYSKDEAKINGYQKSRQFSIRLVKNI